MRHHRRPNASRGSRRIGSRRPRQRCIGRSPATCDDTWRPAARDGWPGSSPRAIRSRSARGSAAVPRARQAFIDMLWGRAAEPGIELRRWPDRSPPAGTRVSLLNPCKPIVKCAMRKRARPRPYARASPRGQTRRPAHRGVTAPGCRASHAADSASRRRSLQTGRRPRMRTRRCGRWQTPPADRRAGTRCRRPAGARA